MCRYVRCSLATIAVLLRSATRRKLKLVTFNEKHRRRVLHELVAHYNRERPHASLGSGIPGATDRADSEAVSSSSALGRPFGRGDAHSRRAPTSTGWKRRE